MKRASVPALALAFGLLGGGGAWAHTGLDHALSFGAGLAHPWSGADHLLAMVAVGLWAGLNGGRALWAWPAAFVAVMAAGGALGMTGWSLPAVETGIVASVIALGLLVAAGARAPVAAGAALIAAFALLHGHAHGAELPPGSAAVAYGLGFSLATAVLHGVGLAVALAAGSERGRLGVRGLGAVVAAAGLALAAL